MSEYQYVAFRAVDKPVSGKNLEFMERQSSRARITPWSFENEYHYANFRGDALEMLRRGYDVHLHYANFGTRNLYIRLPTGFPDAPAAKPYLLSDLINFHKDKNGTGGTLAIEPFFESDYVEQIGDLEGLFKDLINLRAEILDGDLRPLYLAHLACCLDCNHDPEEETEGPVPAGLKELTGAQAALADYLGLDRYIIAAAAEKSPPLPTRKHEAQYADWIRCQPNDMKDEWLSRILKDGASMVRPEMLELFRSSLDAPTWPTHTADRIVADLLQKAEEIAEIEMQKRAEATARKRAKLLADMKANPKATMQRSKELAESGGSDAYRQIAELLADLREALSGTANEGLAEEQAERLRSQFPTRRNLVAALRNQGFLPKATKVRGA